MPTTPIPPPTQEGAGYFLVSLACFAGSFDLVVYGFVLGFNPTYEAARQGMEACKSTLCVPRNDGAGDCAIPCQARGTEYPFADFAQG